MKPFIRKFSSNNRKGMIFAGCSFTWGQGLYYYSNMNSMRQPEVYNTYYPELVRYTHYRFAESVRFPRLVANYFNTFELCQTWNGGATDSIIRFWNSLLEPVSEDKLSIINGNILKSELVEYGSYLRYDDISHLVFQYTQWERSRSPVLYYDQSLNRVEYCSHHDCYSTYKNEFLEYLNNNNLTMEQYDDKHIKFDIKMVKDFLQKFEDNGVKTYILVWPKNISNHILQDSWLKDRFIFLNYNNNKYNDIDTLHENHPELKISQDFENFEIPPVDNHPSLKCHRVMADNVIRKIEYES